MSDQCTGMPFSSPVIPMTNPARAPSSSYAPAATPPRRWLTIMSAMGTSSENPVPQVASCSAMQAS